MNPFELLAFFYLLSFLKMYSNTLIQGFSLVKYDYMAYPEDIQTFSKSKESKTQPDLHRRATALWRNDLENLVPFCLVLTAATYLEIEPKLILGFGIGFMFTRIGHAVFMIFPRQPHRTLFYNTGILLLLAMTAYCFWNIFS